MIQNEAIITQWAPALLKMELDNVLWRDADNIAVKKLWDYLCTYCYLPRLANENVLEETIRTGLNSTEYFTFASGFDGNRYIDLKFNQYVGIVERSGYLVKVSVAQKQIAEEEVKHQAESPSHLAGRDTILPINESSGSASTVYTGPQYDNYNAGTLEAHETSCPETPKNTRFYMSAQLDTTRIGRDVQKLVEEVISHLTSVDGAQVEVSLELNVKAPDGLSQQVVRTLSENCRTLRVRSFGFDE